MFIYLASPYTILNQGLVAPAIIKKLKEARFQDVCKKAAELMQNGHQVFCPIAHSHPIELYGMDEVKSGDFWLEQDFAILIHCDELWVYMLPGWDKSSGVKREVAFAARYNIPVKYLNDGVFPLTQKEALQHGAHTPVIA